MEVAMGTEGRTASTGRKTRGRSDLAEVRIDQHVGQRIKLLRGLRGQSQTDLARALGLTFQQVQKYESGTNRVAVSRLVRIAEALDAPVGYFLDGLEGGAPAGGLPDHEIILAATRLQVLPEQQRRAIRAFISALTHMARAADRGED
jgi:transcriptional regulator with XRE-family HTH domain